MKTLCTILVGIFAFYPLPGNCDAQEEGFQRPHATVEIYRFEARPELAQKAKLFTFHRTQAGYSLTWNQTGKDVCKDVYYVKTFGGRPATVEIHLINDRLFVYPETIKDSEVKKTKGTNFHDMMAVTRLYDTRSGKVLDTSAPYQYNHDVFLKYDVDMALLFLWRADQNDPNKDQKGGTRQRPATEKSKPNGTEKLKRDAGGVGIK